MEHKLALGKVDGYNSGYKNCEAELEWKLTDDGRFSMSGNIWNHLHTDIIRGGQCVDEVVSYFPNNKKAQRMAEIWKRWHLNNMQPSCKHQREWDTSELLTLANYSWTNKYYSMRQAAENGELSGAEYAAYQDITPKVHAALFGLNAPKYESPEIKQLIADGFIEQKGTKQERAGWVRVEEHPQGLLCKPCPVCGYKYGSAWLKEEIPADVIAEIKSWSNKEGIKT